MYIYGAEIHGSTLSTFDIVQLFNEVVHFLPLHSPDNDPIEEMLSKVKTVLK